MQVSYMINLFDKDTAELAALIDGNRVTGLRTASTTAVGASTILPNKPVSIGVISSGFEARSHLQALGNVAEFSSIRVFSPTPANREAVVAAFSTRDGSQAGPVSSSDDAVDRA